MTPDLENIQTVRRLIRAKRYEEAYALLKQTIHPQVPALESKLQELMEANDHKLRPARRLHPWSFALGLFLGGMSVLIVYLIGVQNIAVLCICFAMGLILGVIVPEHIRQHPDHSEYFITQRKKRGNRTWRW